MKHLRLSDLEVLPTFMVEWLRCISWRRLLLLHGRSGLGRFAGYALSALLSLRYPIDRAGRVYRSKSSLSAEAGVPLEVGLRDEADAQPGNARNQHVLADALQGRARVQRRTQPALWTSSLCSLHQAPDDVEQWRTERCS